MPHATRRPLALALLLLAGVATAQSPIGHVPITQAPGGQAPAPTAEAPAVIDAGAKQLWDGFLAASRPEEDARAPLTAFDVELFVRQRTSGSNDLDGVAVSFQSPDLVRCSLPSGNAIGHGAGTGLQRFWLRDEKQDEVVRLVEAEHQRDREQVLGLLAIAKNFVALSDPERLRVTSLEQAEAPQHVLPDPRIPGTLSLRWIAIVSPDFTVGKQPEGGSRFRPAAAPTLQRVLIGLDRRSSLPRLVLIGDDRDGTVDLRLGGKALLIHLPKDSFAKVDGFLVPQRMHTYALEPTEHGPRFAAKPLQEFLVEHLRLRATFPEGHFEPAGR